MAKTCDGGMYAGHEGPLHYRKTAEGGEYVCEKCGQRIAKQTLKKETDHFQLDPGLGAWAKRYSQALADLARHVAATGGRLYVGAINGLVPAGGGAFEVSVAAATAVLGYDLLTSEAWKTSASRRALRAVGFCGSAAAGDTEVEGYVGMTQVFDLFNVTTGFPTKDHMTAVGELILPNAPLTAKVVDAPATNPINGLFDIVRA